MIFMQRRSISNPPFPTAGRQLDPSLPWQNITAVEDNEMNRDMLYAPAGKARLSN